MGKGERPRPLALDRLEEALKHPGYLHQLHDTGMQLFETAIADVELSTLFIDRHEDYALPAWVPIEDAFSRAYQLLWRRLGVIIDVEGRSSEWWRPSPSSNWRRPAPSFSTSAGSRATPCSARAGPSGR
jgi:hypothetical protein